LGELAERVREVHVEGVEVAVVGRRDQEVDEFAGAVDVGTHRPDYAGYCQRCYRHPA
jgi:hypothetical protein